MRPYDFTPLYRSTVGFDRLVSIFDHALNVDSNASSYPPYNIERIGDDTYRISIAVAGFSENELTVEMRENQLLISAKKEQQNQNEVTYLHRGIANRAFEKRFHLADHVRATNASIADGMLHIELLRDVPEALKPRRIEIGTAKTPSAKAAKTAG